jgi:cell division protein ZapA (FtsZ GTPase activity inhibitor)
MMEDHGDRWKYLERYKDHPFTRPSKEKLLREYLERLTHPGWFRDTLVERHHRDAFDQLVNVWNNEETAITRSSDVLVLDAMNLLAAVHVAYELKKLERLITDLEKHIDAVTQRLRVLEHRDDDL